ncbi:MAG: hypothetical protein H7Y38_06360 [Armatimonadetes bacterium]|nr:hypothetical protein [Armatimonadota bacterium]
MLIRQTTANPEFAPGEAETIVKQIRRDYRFAAQMEQSGEASRAGRAKRRADDALEALQRRLERVLDRQVNKRIRFASVGEREDALADLQLKVIMAIQDTSETPGALYWERHFNKCVLSRTLDVLRTVQKRYFEKPASNEESTSLTGAREITFSALEKNSGGGVSGSAGGERFIDTNALLELEAVLRRDVLDKLVVELGEKQRGYLSLLLRQYGGETWEEIAATEQLTPDTARKRGQAVLTALRKIATA